jgi:hypothetical protein
VATGSCLLLRVKSCAGPAPKPGDWIDFSGNMPLKISLFTTKRGKNVTHTCAGKRLKHSN